MNHPTGVDLTTDLAGLRLATPVVTASGCGGTGRELAPYLDLAALGAFTTRTVTLDPRPGSPGRRVVPTAAGVLADTGYQNPGLQGFLATELPWLAQQRVPTIVSVTASSLGEYGELAGRVGNAPGVHGVEVNLDAVTDPHQTGKVLHVVRREVPRGVLVLVKVRPGAGSVDVARAAVREGADAVVVGHGLPGLVLDPDTLVPVLGSGRGWLSGPALLPVTLQAVWDLHTELPGVPLVACGGVRTGADAVALLAAGATAVQVGTALLGDPAAPATVAGGLADDLARRGLASPSALVGLAHRGVVTTVPAPDPDPPTDPGERP